MSEQVSTLVFIKASEGPRASTELEVRLQQLVSQSLGEPGCLAYSLQRSLTDQHLWLLQGTWQSSDALNAYLCQPPLQLLGGLLGERLVVEMDLHTFSGAVGQSAAITSSPHAQAFA
ncbi:antibiotic biosynthesis monooxygenase family protein [Pseudomonas sp. GV071]|jgi:quinol monooxygenase YgiN|uniref:antibiotic biosynthesis monooxygenase family protein n=1 Tax=Pseudomonas sp. GV071 TaxID=2135754 RepID=UPI000D3AA451|nr:antibiotic biosynthesis monooxygenase family protein [Pseudomonas sp. GV071]PTQ69207.1 quinol monooxygenase YgiN [Pseudomonas sp. GV071]